MLKKLRAMTLNPGRLVVQNAVQVFGDYESKLKFGAIPRAQYGFCLYNAARLANKLGYKHISAIEFGVAGGNGLVNLEFHAAQISKLVPIDIQIYGFDTGQGLPRPVDYRDLPYYWQEGFYKMDIETLKSRLTKAKLIIGNISDTLGKFFQENEPAPVGAIAFDLDFYSSTKDSLKILLAPEKYLMPRIFCYSDDILGTEMELYNDFTGQRLAINEFNNERQDIKLGVPYYLANLGISDAWWHQIWIAHIFNHSLYNKFVGGGQRQLPLSG